MHFKYKNVRIILMYSILRTILLNSKFEGEKIILMYSKYERVGNFLMYSKYESVRIIRIYSKYKKSKDNLNVFKIWKCNASVNVLQIWQWKDNPHLNSRIWILWRLCESQLSRFFVRSHLFSRKPFLALDLNSSLTYASAMTVIVHPWNVEDRVNFTKVRWY